ncbi:MAG: DUF1328 domain-containing protein [Actinomycetota bacterium]|jgi:uncharacterized membrane protein YtjA (UPF0391 family)|nr:DUF1328 domain-containing protein [Actinomycetota bacterium]
MVLLILAIIFFILAVLAGIFGLRRVASASCLVSRILFFLLVAGFVISIVLYIFNLFFKFM